MAKKVINLAFALLSLFFVGYLLYPSRPFPEPPPDSTRSREDGDNETPLRRAYFTDYTREQVIEHYTKQFDYLPFFRLNYPPEDSQTLIRDQTRSTFLEEIVHPLRESVYINGFEPKDPKDDVWYKGVDFRQKIIIKYVSSPFIARLIFAIPTLLLLYILLLSFEHFLTREIKETDNA